MKSLLSLNLAFSWLWILAGFVSGMIMGMHFHKKDWKGGYDSFPRRLYRLGHIAFFGTAIINLLFVFSVSSIAPDSALVQYAGILFLLGAITMPLTCLAAAHRPNLRPFFAVPVISLITGGILTFTHLLMHL